MTLTGRSRPLVFREGVVQAVASRTYECAGNGDTANRQFAPGCKRKIKGRADYRFGAHLRRGRQRHCDKCAALFFVDVEASFPKVRWQACEHCQKDYMLRREPKTTPVYDPQRDTFGVYYVGACGCPEATAKRERQRKANEEFQRTMAPLFHRMLGGYPTRTRKRSREG